MSTIICTTDGCERPAVSRGLCRQCYDARRLAEKRAGTWRPGQGSVPKPKRKRKRPSKHPRKKIKPDTTRRICLACDKPFTSEGPWNRICKRCNKANETTHVGGPRGRLILSSGGGQDCDQEDF